MTTTVYKYRIYCNTEAAYVYTWGTSEPTVCPNNNGHSINTSLTSVVETVSNNNTEVTNFPLTAFGELNSAELNPILQLYFTYNNSPQDFATATTGSGTVTNANSMGVVSSGAATSSSAALYSLKLAILETVCLSLQRVGRHQASCIF